MKPRHRTVPAPASPHLAGRLPELRAALQQQRQFRLEQLRELAEEAANSSPAADDVHDEVGEILRASATTALAEAEAALERMRTGSYGICERCTEPVSFERLEILPMSRYCMRCQHAHEMHSNQRMEPKSDASRGPIVTSPVTPRITR
jgi:RNA polymerase-binding transcription factor DksA